MTTEKQLTRKIVLIITGVLFIIFSVIITCVSLYKQKVHDQKLSSNNSSNEYSDVSSETSKNQIQFGTGEPPIASETFAESSNEQSDIENSDKTDESMDSSESGESGDSDNGHGEIEDFHGWIINEFGYTYVYNGCGYEQFNYKYSAMERYVSSLNNLALLIPESTRVFNITVPVASTFVNIPREIYVDDNFFNQSQSAFVSTVESKLDSRFKNISIVSELEKQYDDGEYVFFRTDKNWTSLGAYTAYRNFCESASVEYLPLESFPITAQSEFLGSFYMATDLKLMSDTPDLLICRSAPDNIITELTVYDSGIVYKDYKLCDNGASVYTAYNKFLGTTAERYEIKTNASGGKLLIIGDTSVYPLVAYLAAHYSEIDIVNPMEYNGTISQVISNKQYDDCITICYSTNAINGSYVPSFNIFTGVVENE